MPALDLRLRVASPGLVELPWDLPLAEWDPTAVAMRDVPVGPSRHLVRFVEADGRLWALKDLPLRTAQREYAALRALEDRALAGVRAAGIVVQPGDDAAILVTHHLERSWQYRRLLLRVPVDATRQRARLLDALALLLVDLHRNGVWWGDCSLANTLFTRDGQVLQAWLVDAETAEVHPTLSVGQRRADLDVAVENVAGGLLDVAARRDELPAAADVVLAEAASVAARYDGLWGVLHDEPDIDLGDQHQIDRRLRTLNDLGYAVDEVRLEAPARAHERARLRVAVAERRFHSTQLRGLTGLEVGEGQATVLLNDLRGYHACLQHREGSAIPEAVAARRWVLEAYLPGVARAHAARGGRGDPAQAYCDLLEVRWLLSEVEGADVGEARALAALAEEGAPADAAAALGFVDPTGQVPAVPHPRDEEPGG